MKETRDRARELRRDGSFPERLLWSKLRNRHLGGLKFRRQHPIGPYFADFACEEAKLIIELDGDTHGNPDQQAHDARRTAFLESQDWQVVRIWNSDLLENIDGVLDTIQLTLIHISRTRDGST
ncbi:endonuclease domain-containing protein [Hyphomonas oceanitis]|uniref:endonuclease domain-containing protein n=1 Tax=Hyphomonas oceanitis TaxID=81033 RepID=UPI000689E21B|nr:endonuclease domain-containing protein [Hyphomonas oceanitis]